VMSCLRVLAHTWRAVCRRSYASFPPSSDSTAMSIFCVERLRTQERWNPEVTIIFGAARYRRAAVCRSHDDAHPGNSALYTGAFRPHTGFVGSLFFIFSRTGHSSSEVLEKLQALSGTSWACAFLAGNDASIHISGSVEAEGRHKCSVSAGLLFWNAMARPLPGEDNTTARMRISVQEEG
jgi:hypothetical protein